MVSKRLQNVPTSGTVKISNIVSQLKSEGADILSFSMGEPDFATPENIIDACVDSLRDQFTHYTPSLGIPELREAIAAKTRKENNIKCTSKNVLVTPTKHAIFMIALAYLDPGDEVLLADPSWVTYDACIRLAGAKPVYVPTSYEDEFTMTPEMMAEKVTDKTRMVFLNSPCNPTGTVMSRNDLKGIADLCMDHDLRVLSDEIYERIIYEGEHISIGSLDGMFDRTLTVSGLSKTYAMTGWRLGWLVAPESDIKEVNKLQTHSITCCASFTQPAAVEALTGPQGEIDRMVGEFRKRRDLMCDLIEDIPGLCCTKPKGAFYVFPRYDLDMSSEDFAAYLLKEAHVAVTPGSAFGPSGEGYLRLSYAASEEQIIEGMQRIKDAMSRL
ncbi:MAG: pyridoxal phosphate-dependent aminotransferase [Candidatus Methanomethylophilaceae archaeon]|nr:pyridoxal phosphate-dependent aminotransferase [Candidatus Methanomethylophilaceae archaeon]